MYLKEIRAYGFKSFADKINIEFGKDINGIVGPNGTGKSNIVDAVRWVLGEQSIKSLRAENSNDVIFTGSSSRKPLNSASVTLVFDNTDKVLPIDFNEVSIKRVVFRDGVNEYYINNSKCRLKDITDLLIESGAAKESFNIIGQGKIDEILSTRPVDRRVIFEEAAGVLKYKKRKEEAIKKLDRTSLNINRVNDIISELSTNLEPLKYESLRAKEYNNIKDKLKDIEISLLVDDIEKTSTEYNESKLKLDELTDSITVLNSSSSGYDVSLFKEKDLLKTTIDNITNKNSKILEQTKKIEKIDADIRILKEREKYKTETDKIGDNILSIKEDILKLENQVNLLDNDIAINNEKINNFQSNINSIDSDISKLNVKNNKINDNINLLNKNKTDITYKIDYLENSINNLDTVPSAVKNILSNPKFTKVHNIIGNLIKVNDEYSIAISTSLGASSNYIVTENTDCIKEMVYYLKDHNIGRATFYPLDTIKPRNIDFNTLSILSSFNGFVNTADKLTKYDKIYENIILNQLGNVIIVDNIDNANILSKKIFNKYKIVTLDGQVVNVGGSITGGKNIKDNNVITLKYDLDKNRYDLNNIMNNLKELDKELNDNISKINNLNNNLFKLKNDKNELIEINNNKLKSKLDINNLLEIKNNELKDLNNITNNKSDLELLLDSYYKEKDVLNNLDKELNILKLDKDKLELSISEIEKDINSSNSIISKKEKELNNLNILVNRMDVKLDNLLDYLSSTYNITFEYAKENYKLEIDSDNARSEVNNLKNKLNNLGIVNLGSIEEYERINNRYEFLVKQKDDLLNAKDTLNEIINEMDAIMKNKFLETFDLIKKEFKVVFRELFKGGNAELILDNPDDILETGIEIKAEPPGKKLQTLSLLSGGEKTFTAISLLFAILNVRTVPFCIFDEVEAALDDENVENFGNYLNTYKDKTQFILITHKKKTMEFADILYGVTMQESGVSKMVSVKLEDIKI